VEFQWSSPVRGEKILTNRARIAEKVPEDRGRNMRWSRRRGAGGTIGCEVVPTVEEFRCPKP
jgi:hypothetical protein